MAAIPGIELLAAAWGIAALLVVISLIWNRPLNLPVLTMPIALSESSSRQTPFVTHFADEYELWIEFVTEGRPPDGWKRLFGFGVPPFPGVPVLVQWEVLDCCNNTIITAGESESTSGNSFSGGLVGRRLARLKLPQGRLLLRVTIPRKVALLLSYPASLRLQIEPTTAQNWRYVLYWGVPYTTFHIFIPLLVVASLVVLYRVVVA